MLKHRYAQHVIHWIEHPISACSTCHTLTLDALLFCHAYVRQKLEVATSVRERAVVLMTTWAKQVPFTFGGELPGCNELCMVWQVPISKQLAYTGTQALNPRPTRCASTWTRHSRWVFSDFPGNSHLSQNETQTHMMFPHDCPPNITKKKRTINLSNSELLFLWFKLFSCTLRHRVPTSKPAKAVKFVRPGQFGIEIFEPNFPRRRKTLGWHDSSSEHWQKYWIEIKDSPSEGGELDHSKKFPIWFLRSYDLASVSQIKKKLLTELPKTSKQSTVQFVIASSNTFEVLQLAKDLFMSREYLASQFSFPLSCSTSFSSCKFSSWSWRMCIWGACRPVQGIR